MSPEQEMNDWERLQHGIIELAASVDLGTNSQASFVVYGDDERYQGVRFTREQVLAAKQLARKSVRT